MKNYICGILIHEYIFVMLIYNYHKKFEDVILIQQFICLKINEELKRRITNFVDNTLCLKFMVQFPL